MEQLDKNERYVLGAKVDARDLETYRQMVEAARETNIRLGYGTSRIDYDQKAYEEILRNINTDERIRKAYEKEFLK